MHQRTLKLLIKYSSVVTLCSKHLIRHHLPTAESLLNSVPPFSHDSLGHVLTSHYLYSHMHMQPHVALPPSPSFRSFIHCHYSEEVWGG